jgi:diguanylate cyclase (GGDEF)-like protein/PAS domain S-box-containing protein
MTAAPHKFAPQTPLELRAILENATVGILFTRNRQVHQANPLCAQMFGYTLEEFIGLGGAELYPTQADYDVIALQAGPVLRRGLPFRAELPLRRKDGSQFWCHVSAKAIDPQHPQEGTVWMMEDVSEDRAIREALEHSSVELGAIFETVTLGIAVVRQRQFVRCNRRFEEMLGYAVGTLVGRSVRLLYPSVAEFETVGASAYGQLARGEVHHREQAFARLDGSTFWGSFTGKAFDAQRPQDGSVWVLDDISIDRDREEALRRALAEQEMIFDNAAVGILFVRNRHVQRCNRRLEEIFGWDGHELDGKSTRVFFLDENDYLDLGMRAYDTILRERVWIGEQQVRHKSGKAFWVRVTGRSVSQQNNNFDVIWIFEDITERREAQEALLRAHNELEQRVEERTAELATANSQLQEEIFERMQAEQRIWHTAHHDALTGLPNRALLLDRLEQVLGQAARNQHRVAVMFLDLDRFKSINDTLGHHVGDELLKSVANRLRSVVRAVDTVSRLGGDEFVVILQEIAGTDDAVLVAEKIINILALPIEVDGHELRATPSIGIGIFPDDGNDTYSLMKNADTAMYHAKAAGRNNFQFFTASMNADAERFFNLEQRLRSAINGNQLVLHYQPLVDYYRREVCGVEALVRWQDPEQGLIAPGDFIPLAEETGLIVPLGEWVLTEALRQNRSWQAAGHAPLPISVNLSPRQFRQARIVDEVRRILVDSGQPPHLLELEITESSLMQDVAETRAKLEELSALGVRLAIDDFGTGYSSLNYLKRFPVHKLKIDQSFVRDLTEDRDDACIVSAIIGLARSLGMDTLAEGVETDRQLATLIGLGCSKFQGFLFSRPLAAEPSANLFDLPLLRH